MALTNSQTFYGKDSAFFYGAALGTGKAKNEVTILGGVKDSINVNSFNLGTVSQTGSSCTFNSSGEGTLDEKNIAVEGYKINLEFCTDAFEASWLSLQMRAGSSNTQIPASFNEYLLGKVAEKVSNEVETAMFSKLVTDALADGSIIDVSAIAFSAMTKSNVVTELDRVITALPSAVRADMGNVVIFVSSTVANLLRQYYGTIALAGFGPEYAQTGVLNYLGYRIVETTELSGLRMIAGLKNNLFYVTDLGSDESEIKVIDMLPSTGARAVRVVGFFKAGFGYGTSADVVLYS